MADALTRAVIVPEFPEGSHEWWIAEAQIEELVRLGGREIVLRRPDWFGDRPGGDATEPLSVWVEVEHD